jgi:hypothetical protein
MRLRALGAEAGAGKMAATRKAVSVEFDAGRVLSRQARAALQQEFGPGLAFAWRDTPSVTFTFPDGQDPLQAADHLLNALANA